MSYNEIIDFSLSRSLREGLRTLGYGDKDVGLLEKYSKGTEPKGTYLAYYLLSTEDIGGAETTTYLMSDRKAYNKQTMKGTVQLSLFGDRAKEVGGKIFSRIPSNKPMREIFSKWGFAVTRKSSLRSNPQLRENEWVDSVNFDLDILFAYYYKEDSDWWEFFTANGVEFSIAKQ